MTVKKYEAPEIVITELNKADVITTSMALPIVPLDGLFDW